MLAPWDISRLGLLRRPSGYAMLEGKGAADEEAKEHDLDNETAQNDTIPRAFVSLD
jgi:hypothetical protein